MPIYEYHCDECDSDFETLIWKTDSTEKQICPKCGSKKTVRKFSTFSTASAPGSSTGSCNSPSTKFK